MARETVWAKRDRNAGAMAEKVMDTPYADLMQKFVFAPLGMTSVGYGTMNSAGKADQPWGHTMNGSTHIPMDVGPSADNPQGS